jgi:hypothetical protein
MRPFIALDNHRQAIVQIVESHNARNPRVFGSVIHGTSGGKGRIKFAGGTGKYSGATGGCEYQTKYLPDNWSVVESDCSRD